MKKIKYFVLAFAAVCLTVGLASCEKEKEVEKIVEKPVEVIKEVEVPVEVPQDNNWSQGNPARGFRFYMGTGL